MAYQMLVTVDKNALLEKMRENRANHREIFAEALEGYRQAAIARLEGELTALRVSKRPRKISIHLDRPEDHTRDYDRVIGMLEMHDGAKFTIDEGTYAKYMNDQWDWREHFLRLSSSYSTRAAQMYDDDEDDF